MTEEIGRMKIEEVAKHVRLSKSTVYRMIRDGLFPKQVKTSPNTVAWIRSEVDSWFAERAAARGVQ